MIAITSPRAVFQTLDQIVVQNAAPTRRQGIFETALPLPEGRIRNLSQPLVVRNSGTGAIEQVDYEPFGLNYSDGSFRFVRVSFPVVLAASERRLVDIGFGNGLNPGFVIRPEVLRGIQLYALTLQIDGSARQLNTNLGYVHQGNRSITLFSRGRFGDSLDDPRAQFWYWFWMVLGSDMDHAHCKLWYGNSWVETFTETPRTLSRHPNPGHTLAQGIYLSAGPSQLLDLELCGSDRQIKQVARVIQEAGEHRITLLDQALNDARFPHGVSQAIEFSIMFPDGVTEQLRLDTLQAEHEDEIAGSAKGWDAAKLANFFSAKAMPVPSAYLNNTEATEDADVIALARRQSFISAAPWDIHEQAHSGNNNPAGTATQKDFGRVFLHPESKSDSVLRLLAIARDSKAQAHREMWYREWDTLLYPTPTPYGDRHPECFFWFGRPFWQSNGRTEDLFGKERGIEDFERPLPVQPGGAWFGFDKEHWSLNHLIHWYLRTGNRLAGMMLQDAITNWIFCQPVRPLGGGNAAPNLIAPRAIDRMMQFAALAYLATGRQDLKDRGDYWVTVVRSDWDGQFGGTLRYSMIGESREQEHLFDPPWFYNPWQEGMAVGGLYAWHVATGNADALALAKEIARTVCMHGVQDRRTTTQVAEIFRRVNGVAVDRTSPTNRPQVGDLYEQRDLSNVVVWTGTFYGLAHAAWAECGGDWLFRACTGQIQPQRPLVNLTRAITDALVVRKLGDWQILKSIWWNDREPLSQAQLEEWLPEGRTNGDPILRYVQWGDNTAYLYWASTAFFLSQKWAREASDAAWQERADALAAFLTGPNLPNTWGNLPGGDEPWMWVLAEQDVLATVPDASSLVLL